MSVPDTNPDAVKLLSDDEVAEVCHCADGGGPIRVHGHDLVSQPHHHTEQGIELLDESEKYGRVGPFGNYRAEQWKGRPDDDN